MANNIGVNVYEAATSSGLPVEAKVSIPYVVGTAPAHTAKTPGQVGKPVLVTSWEDAVEKLGYSEDWNSYTLCEFMYSHLKLYERQPVLLYNALDTATMKEAVVASSFTVANHQAKLPLEALIGTLEVKNGETTLAADTDYTAFYGEDRLIVELLEDGSAYAASTLSIAYNAVKPGNVTEADVAAGIEAADACMTATGVVPDLLCAPGWSGKPAIAALLATKAEAISGCFKGKALVDIPCGTDGITDYSALSGWKNSHNFVDENQIICWPMVRLGDKKFHLSTQLAGLMAKVDAGNDGKPYESPSNKSLLIDGTCLADGTELTLTWPQVQLIAGSWGIVTAVNFLDTGWVAKGNLTACYPGNSDVKDKFIPVSRMFDWIGNTLIRTFFPSLDKPLNRVLIQSFLTTCNNWLDGLSGGGYLNGARAQLRPEENSVDALLDGLIRLHVYNAPPVPAQQIDFTLEYDISYAQAAASV